MPFSNKKSSTGGNKYGTEKMLGNMLLFLCEKKKDRDATRWRSVLIVSFEFGLSVGSMFSTRKESSDQPIS